MFIARANTNRKQKAKAAIAGLGMTDMTRKYTKPMMALAIDALRAAIEDAG